MVGEVPFHEFWHAHFDAEQAACGHEGFALLLGSSGACRGDVERAQIVTAEAHRRLGRQFETRLVAKRYTAVLEGIVNGEAGEIRLPFRLDPDNRPYQVYDPVHGRMGITRWRRLAAEHGRTRIEFIPLKPARELRGMLRGLDTTFERDREDRV